MIKLLNLLSEDVYNIGMKQYAVTKPNTPQDSLKYAYQKEEIYKQDHEVSMALGLLEDIIKNANELMSKIGNQEKNLPGWIQDHISQAQNYIDQANTGYHEL